jgi:Arc/MetJ-type ribon-helix-helix transcriptional regulator
MKVELTPDATQWVEATITAGRFATAEDAVRYAIKRTDLSEMLAASEAEGGKHTADDVRRYVREHLDRLRQTKK